MSGKQIAYAAPLALSVLACALVVAMVWQRRRTSDAVRAFCGSVLGQVSWGIGYLGELSATSLPNKVLWDIAQLLPAYAVGLEAFRFAVSYTGSKLLDSRRARGALWALPAVHLAFAFTSHFHDVVYADSRLVPGDPFPALVYSFTPLDQLCYGYLFVVGIATVVLLFRAVWSRSRQTYRAQVVPVAIALSLPMISAILLMAGIPVLGQRDSAPYAFAVSSVIVAHTLLRRRLFDLNPIAYEAVVEAAPEAVLVIDESERVVDANPALIHLVGHDRELVGQPLSSAVPWATMALTTGPWQPLDIELSPDCILEARSAPLTGRSAEVVGRVLTFQDVTLTRRAAQLLKQQNQLLEQRVQERTLDVEASRKQLRDVLDQAFQLMGIAELDGTLTHVNRAALDMVGARREDVLGKKFWDTPWWAHSSELQSQLRAAISKAAGGELVRFSTTHRDRSGAERDIDFSIKPVLDEHGRATVLVPEGRDVTDLRRAEEHRRSLEQQLIHAQKVDSLGRLAGGVAHDFNNLLTAIMGNVELARMDLPDDAEVRPFLDEVVHASESAKALVQQLLVFTRKPSREVAVVDLCATVEATVRMLGRVLGEDVAITTKLPGGKLNVRMDPRQLEQVLVNLTVNARDAMAQGGKVGIEVDVVGEGLARRARLRVSDTGAGMTKAVMARVFEPFFTTKPVGKGTGLGLALVFEVVRQAGGEVLVQSEVERGSTFTVELPEAASEAPAAAVEARAELPGGRETILLVEDQAELSRVAQRLLRRLGYTVHSFANGEELLQVVDRLPRADLLLSDVVLPGINGPALAERLAVPQPWLKVVFASGYHEESLAQRSEKLATSRVLAKPFSLEELARAVRTALEAPR